MRRLVLIPLRVATAILAFIGLVWIVAARPTVEMLCSNRLTLVRYHAMVAEKRGNWLDAAHDYAHLLEYDDDSEDGCRSSELNQNAWLIPFGALLLTAPERSQEAKDRPGLASSPHTSVRSAMRKAPTPLSVRRLPAGGSGNVHHEKRERTSAPTPPA
jgi:hypothetical protein